MFLILHSGKGLWSLYRKSRRSYPWPVLLIAGLREFLPIHTAIERMELISLDIQRKIALSQNLAFV